jgi:hypothetical protein
LAPGPRSSGRGGYGLSRSLDSARLIAADIIGAVGVPGAENLPGGREKAFRWCPRRAAGLPGHGMGRPFRPGRDGAEDKKSCDRRQGVAPSPSPAYSPIPLMSACIIARMTTSSHLDAGHGSGHPGVDFLPGPMAGSGPSPHPAGGAVAAAFDRLIGRPWRPLREEGSARYPLRDPSGKLLVGGS